MEDTFPSLEARSENPIEDANGDLKYSKCQRHYRSKSKMTCVAYKRVGVRPPAPKIPASAGMVIKFIHNRFCLIILIPTSNQKQKPKYLMTPLSFRCLYWHILLIASEIDEHTSPLQFSPTHRESPFLPTYLSRATSS